MGILGRLIRGRVAGSAIRAVRREASKPQNQEKARRLMAKLRRR
ncbi:hypothetical protein BJEO58_00741 [Brevibacterium jeotgali]|uniref:Uncharacterized protein n=1 Tax=Brevibacterium jeotgali TaxID=1262550 RepID=A0A2H1L2W1_9MICO|nr:hypothetical protein FB108_1040 [Brevibacterium jeotgali]SMY11159.1 hypothetical protein BJEO58_00741 [Brevibacterium jeotgali]